ncbi:O-antigen ligase family protein [Desulfuromonas sp. AOP6]|uniref:O-antigen ligase family protein n=1 Tax=Desulfuromonas sp. AOP6 TaxID=1566351 RepID=UPI001282DEC0|nr:O-antigen ligase family protein [Desulfuromonas sp. AOP6]BCA79502.1 hypothetical protein AOP6_1289 [Desulfuromonas sp. AOP6]
MKNLGFYLYLVFVCSWFLHLPARLPILGNLRFDLFLVLVLALIVIFENKNNFGNNNCVKRLNLLILIIIIITPFAEWPGSAIKFGLPNFIKAVVFFYFTITFAHTEKKFKTLITCFILCQLFRVIEPLYLHITEGYWGDSAYIGSGDFMARLSGAPHDVVNPNGLAFVILTIIPFLFLYLKESLLWRILALSAMPVLLYALYLTGSRSGMIGLFLIMFILMYFSKNKAKNFTILLIAGCILFPKMDSIFKDRYLSIFSENTKNSITSSDRQDGMIKDFKTGMRRPIFGHGLGTSREVNFNYGNRKVMSHNIYSETFQEIGIVGLIFFILFIISIFENIRGTIVRINNTYLFNTRSAIYFFCIMNVIFGLASYGLSSYEWYLFGGLSVALSNLNNQNGDYHLSQVILEEGINGHTKTQA